MYDDIVNLWKEDSDFNIVRTWLVGGTSGQTYSILDRFLPKLKIDETKYDYDFANIEAEIDEIIGSDHDYKVDDERCTARAWQIVNSLDKFIEKVNANPERYFSLTKFEEMKRETCKDCIHRYACEVNKPDFSMSGSCEAIECHKV